jgi:hypothetical protein
MKRGERRMKVKFVTEGPKSSLRERDLYLAHIGPPLYIENNLRMKHKIKDWQSFI